MNEKPIIYIDGLNVFMRHFAANPSKSLNGQLCGGIIGFLGNIDHLARKFRPQKIVVAWEGGGSLRRRAIDANYKNGRRPVRLNRSQYYKEIPDTEENRNYQLKTLIEILYKTPVVQIYVNDCEADDVIGYLVKNRMKEQHAVIVSSDKDYYQLLSKNIIQWSPGQKKMITPEVVKEKFGVSVTNFCTARSIIGDKSDNIDGVQGAGFKTLVKRFPELQSEEFMSVDDIISLAKIRGEGSKIKVFDRISSSSDTIHRNWRLMHLDTINLSATHIEKISNIFNTSMFSRNKIGLMRLLIQEGLTSFDADSFFMALTASLEVK